jgi:hypothetical protein
MPRCSCMAVGWVVPLGMDPCCPCCLEENDCGDGAVGGGRVVGTGGGPQQQQLGKMWALHLPYTGPKGSTDSCTGLHSVEGGILCFANNRTKKGFKMEYKTRESRFSSCRQNAWLVSEVSVCVRKGLSCISKHTQESISFVCWIAPGWPLEWSLDLESSNCLKHRVFLW